jgi:hypothetical protein
MITYVSPSAQQQAHATPTPLKQRPKQFLSEMARIGRLVQGIDHHHRDQRTRALGLPGQQPGQAAAEGGGVGVDVVETGGRGLTLAEKPWLPLLPTLA